MEVMMNNNALLRLQVRIQQAWINLRDGERGQTMIEYAGIALVAAAVIGIIITVADSRGNDIAQAIFDKISKAIGDLGKKS
ncbi:hypothetical protein BKH30_00460 [Actinomyces oris]|uniref:Flp family type IVb pilin n=1 Tax=Actinomyces oris TaxID=544580 RepID=A0A1Q8W4C7_9ACTO|nr:hypothetical protein BKH30_00460 [Actinomyces oris]